MFGKIALSAAVAMSMASVSFAETINWTATLEQAQETEQMAPAEGAMGTATGTLDTETGKMTYSITYEGLSGDPAAAHFHGPAAKGSDAAPVVTLGADGNFASPMVGEAMATPEQVKDIEAGMWYINIHTAANPKGEIRGQVEKAM